MPLAGLVRVNVAVTPDIDPPGTLNQVGDESFWITLNGTPYLFPVSGQDAAGRDRQFPRAAHLRQPARDAAERKFSRPMPATTTSDGAWCAAGRSPMPTRRQATRSSRRRPCTSRPSSPGWTASRRRSRTSTRRSCPRWTPRPSPCPPCPRSLGQNTAVIISLYLPYLQGGLDSHAGVFAIVVRRRAPAARSARTPAVASPSPTSALTALSARKGLVSGDPDDAASGGHATLDSTSAPPTPSCSAAIDLGDLIPLVDGLADAAQNAPEIRTHAVPNQHHPTQLVTVINWKPQLASARRRPRG